MADIRKKIQASIAAISYSDFLEGAKDLLEVLGYQSNRTLELSGGVDSFVQALPAIKSNTKTERAFREHVQSVRMIFQLTNDEIASVSQRTPTDMSALIDEGRQQSVLFFAVELKRDDYPLGIYDEFTREIDKRIFVPTVVFFRAGTLLTIAVIGRRPHKLDDSRDVLERVTSLSKEIPTESPRDADLDVLSELSLSECTKWMDANYKPYNCESLLAAWLSKLDTTERGRPFYVYTFDWLERAESEAKLPEGEEITLRNYFKDIARSTPLTREREIELAQRTKGGDMKAREAMIVANLRFVIYMAKKYRNRGLPLSDLISAGNQGLITAADRFDGTRGTRFITYAVWWIRQSITKSLEEHSRTVRLPSNKVSLLEKISRKLHENRAIEPTVRANAAELEFPSQDDLEEIAAELGVPAKRVLDIISDAATVFSLDETVTDDDFSLLDILADEVTAPPDADLLRESALKQIYEALELLTPRESHVIRLYFGLNGSDGLTLEEISHMMKLTRERIRQIKEKALKKLRRRTCYEEQELLINRPFTPRY